MHIHQKKCVCIVCYAFIICTHTCVCLHLYTYINMYIFVCTSVNMLQYASAYCSTGLVGALNFWIITPQVFLCVQVCMSMYTCVVSVCAYVRAWVCAYVCSSVLTPGCPSLPSSPALVRCSLSDDVQHLLHLYAHPGLQPRGAAHLHGDPAGQRQPVQVSVTGVNLSSLYR